MSLRLKAALLILATMLCATAVTAALFAALQYNYARTMEEDRQHIILDDVTRVVGESQLAGDPLMLLDALRALIRRHDLLYARVRLAFGWQTLGSLPPAGQALVAVARQSSGEEAVELGFSRRAREDRLRAIRQSLGHHAARAAGLMALCAILLAFPLSATLTKRIRRIESALKAIGSGRREERLPALGADEIGRLAAGVNAMAEQLGELEQLKRTFVASVTHELRSPLDIMESYLDEILRRSQALSERDRADLLRVQGNARRLSHFVTNLLDYAKIERGKLDFAPRTADAAELVDNSVRFFAPKAREAGVALAAEIEPSLPLVRLDPDLYTHVLTNLLSNALKFTPAGGRIQVSLRRRANDLELAVADSGVGIKAPDLARLFLPFERISNPLRANGVGLGLAISRQIATLHRGRLGVVSEWGKGSRFSFTMPMS